MLPSQLAYLNPLQSNAMISVCLISQSNQENNMLTRGTLLSDSMLERVAPLTFWVLFVLRVAVSDWRVWCRRSAALLEHGAGATPPKPSMFHPTSGTVLWKLVSPLSFCPQHGPMQFACDKMTSPPKLQSIHFKTIVLQ